jgi:hypothetical protein
MLRRFLHMLSRFEKRFWTRSFSIILIALLFSLTIALTIIGINVKSFSNTTTVLLAIINGITALIALAIPLSQKDEARRKIQRAMNQYVILRGSRADGGPKNIAVNRMRQLAPKALYPQEELAEYLQSTDVGERVAAIASIQWQWSKEKDAIYFKMGDFKHNKNEKELPTPPKYPDNGYFPELLDMLHDSYDAFENYHATVAMWCMLDALEPGQLLMLYKRFLDTKEGQLPNRCNEWGEFIKALEEKRDEPRKMKKNGKKQRLFFRPFHPDISDTP